MNLDAIQAGNTALVTGGGAGIGLAAATHFARAGMNVVIVDIREELFTKVEMALQQAGAPKVICRKIDVADKQAALALCNEIQAEFGGLQVLMCNAGIGARVDIFNETGNWDKVMGVNLGGVVNFCQTFVPAMMEAEGPGLVINTGSKQGITTPPGNPAYNISKAGVRLFTESLQHHLRGSEAKISAHLLVPGYVFTDMTRGDRTEKPPSAWSAEQTVEFMIESIGKGDFYIICPDNDVTRDMDEKRMAWAMGDIIENRPPLSRWHPDWSDAFDAYMNKNRD